jgi:hypothetical protein
MQDQNASRNVRALFSPFHFSSSMSMSLEYQPRLLHILSSSRSFCHQILSKISLSYGAITKASNAIRVYRPYLIYSMISICSHLQDFKNLPV